MSYTRELIIATRLARAAGAAIMERYGDSRADTKIGGSPVTAADRAANQIIVDGLDEAFPGDAILAEESSDSDERLGRERVWIVDPLDGTKEFLAGNGEFAVMIGLAQAGEPVLGIVYVPATDMLYHAARGSGAFVERPGGRVDRLQISAGRRPPRMIASRSHRDETIDRIRAKLGAAEPTRSGSVGVKCVRIAEGTHDLYFHPVPYLCEWDTCAPEVIASEAGARVTGCTGRPLLYNKPQASQPDGILVLAPGFDDVRQSVMSEYSRASA